MTLVFRLIAGLALSLMLGGCATGQPRGWVDAAAWGANYTEDYIYDYWIKTVDGKDTGVGGVQVHEFSKGGTGGRICCSSMPEVGQIIKVVWRVGGRRDPESQWKTYSQDVVVSGQISANPNRHSYVIVRFFPNHELEAEYIPGDDPRGMRNPRVDKLFLGQRIMRQKGE